MMAKDLIKKLMELPTDVLDSDVYAGDESDDEVVDVYVGNDGEVTLLTTGHRAEFDDEVMEDYNYWKQKKAEWDYDDYVQEKLRRNAG